MGKCTEKQLEAARKYREANREKRREYNRRYRKEKKEICRASCKRYRQRHKDKGVRFRKYKITEQQFNNIVNEQLNKCAICKDECLKLCIDHNHDTGKIRELLCYKCNLALGFIRERIDIAENIISYLRKHNASD